VLANLLVSACVYFFESGLFQSVASGKIKKFVRALKSRFGLRPLRMSPVRRHPFLREKGVDRFISDMETPIARNFGLF
jgi:hypothetical protein